ncbi:MAG: prepilin-type N-terminal cleavage/methylation domain-containing protein [Pusillimonas sp.]
MAQVYPQAAPFFSAARPVLRRRLPEVPAAARQQGFSLIEVLIVLVIIGIATATVSVAAFSGSDSRALRTDAQRLAQLFSLAQAEARKTGNPIIWEYDSQGYTFAQAPRNLFLPTGLARQAGPALAMGFSGALRARDWTPDNAIEVHIEPFAANVFDTEWISGPLAVELRDGINTVRIERLGNGQYRVLQ